MQFYPKAAWSDTSKTRGGQVPTDSGTGGARLVPPLPDALQLTE